MLTAVLAYLDDVTEDKKDKSGRALTFAAVRVQEAIDLIGHPDVLDT